MERHGWLVDELKAFCMRASGPYVCSHPWKDTRLLSITSSPPPPSSTPSLWLSSLKMGVNYAWSLASLREQVGSCYKNIGKCREYGVDGANAGVDAL